MGREGSHLRVRVGDRRVGRECGGYDIFLWINIETARRGAGEGVKSWVVG